MRQLYSANTPCHAGCKYCFAYWKDIYKSQPSIEAAMPHNDSTIIYPCCDGELFEQNDIIDNIKSVAHKVKNLYVSVSTKRIITCEEIGRLISLNEWLKEKERGFVKFSVSVTTKSRIDEIEPRAASYNERLLIVEKLKNANILTSLNIKPILPFVSELEYFEILNDFSKYTNHVMLGGLYVNPSSPFYNTYIDGVFDCVIRKVGWLDNCPEWYYIEDECKTKKIIEHALKLNMQVYKSDVDLINTIKNRAE